MARAGSSPRKNFLGSEEVDRRGAREGTNHPRIEVSIEGLAPGLGLRAIAPRLTCRACRGPVTEVKPCHHGPGSFSAKPWDGPPFA
jgi:hypothetical protein